MNFSQYAGVAIVPTFSRLVLGAVFVFAGYTKLFSSAEFEATADGKGQANRLHALDVPLTPKAAAPATPAPATPAAAAPNARWTGETVVVRAAWRQNESNQPINPANAQSPPATPDQPVTGNGDTAGSGAAITPDTKATTDAATKAATEVATEITTAAPLLAPGTYTAHSLHHITLMVDKAGMPYPVVQGWLAALTEFVGGGLVLIGLFTRIWSLGLAAIMAVAFYLTSLPMLQGASFSSLQPQQLNTTFLQVSLFVLAFGLVLTGPGPLSLDRVLLERKPAPPPSPQRRPHD